MVRALEEEEDNYKSRLYHFKGMHENTGRHTKSLSVESATALEFQDDDKKGSRSNGAQGSKSRLSKEEDEAREKQQQTGELVTTIIVVVSLNK